jgi:hypothetical protein
VAVIKQAEETLSSFDCEDAREIGRGGEADERPVALRWKSGGIRDRVWLLSMADCRLADRVWGLILQGLRCRGYGLMDRLSRVVRRLL